MRVHFVESGNRGNLAPGTRRIIRLIAVVRVKSPAFRTVSTSIVSIGAGLFYIRNIQNHTDSKRRALSRTGIASLSRTIEASSHSADSTS